MLELKNGMRVVLRDTPDVPLVALQLWVNVGSADESAGGAGISHVLEHMVFKGTAKRGVGQIAAEVEALGGDINAWTSFDQTVFHLVVPSRFWRRGLEILADAVLNPTIDRSELTKELRVIGEEIRDGTDAPGQLVTQQLFSTAFKRHAYRRPIVGTARNVMRLTRADVLSFYRHAYRPDRMTLVAVGQLPEDGAADVRRVWNRHSANKSRSSNKSESANKQKAANMTNSANLLLEARTVEPEQRSVRVAVSRRSTKEVHLALGFRIPGLTHEDAPALDLAALILGYGETSRLVHAVREQQQLVTDVWAYAFAPKDHGLLVIQALTEPAKLKRATAAIVAKVSRFASDPITDSELMRAKTTVESDSVYQQETVEGLARTLGYYQAMTGDLGFEHRYRERVARLSKERLQEVAGRYLSQTAGLTVSAVVPLGTERKKRVGNKLVGNKLAVNKLAVNKLAGKKLAGNKLAGELRMAASRAATRVQTGKRSQRARASSKEPTVQDSRVVRVKLDNGARLVVRRDARVGLVAMRAAWLGGVRYENERNNGINQLLAGLITRGSSERSGAQLHEAFEAMAGTIGGFSGRNSFGLRAEVLSQHWQQAFDLLAETALHPTLPQDEFTKRRREALSDIYAQDDDGGAMAMRLFAQTIYTQHPYRLDPVGQYASVSELTRLQLLRYYRRHYPISGMVLAVAGDVDPAAVEERFRRAFGGKSAPAAVPNLPHRTAASRRADAKVATATIEREQAHLVLGYPGTTVRSKDRLALEFISALLTGQGGRLFVELRERRALAYNVSAFSIEGIEPGSFAVYLSTAPGNLEDCIKTIDAEFARLRDSLVAPSELKRVKNYLIGSALATLQRRSALAAQLAFDELYGLGFRHSEKYTAAVGALSGERLRQVARRYFDSGKRTVALVAPKSLSPAAAALFADPRAGIVRPK